MAMKYAVVFVTAGSKEEAVKIANGLIDSKLAACVNILPGIRSFYVWQGRKESSEEVLLIVKTKESLFKDVAQEVKRLHSYDTPEIISIPISEGDERYLAWIEEVLSST